VAVKEDILEQIVADWSVSQGAEINIKIIAMDELVKIKKFQKNNNTPKALGFAPQPIHANPNRLTGC
jgi:hypothetical protein